MISSNAAGRIAVAMISIMLGCENELFAQTTRPIGDGELTIEFPAGWKDVERAGRTRVIDPSGRAFISAWNVQKEDLAEHMTPSDYARSLVASLAARATDVDHGDPVPIESGRFSGVDIEVRFVADQAKWTYVYVVLESEKSFNMIALMARPSAVGMGREALRKMIASIREKEEPPPRK